MPNGIFYDDRKYFNFIKGMKKKKKKIFFFLILILRFFFLFIFNFNEKIGSRNDFNMCALVVFYKWTFDSCPSALIKKTLFYSCGKKNSQRTKKKICI